MSESTFDATQLLSELDGGVFLSKLSQAMKEAALGVVTNGEKGKTGQVTITFTMKRLGESNQIMVDHKLAQVVPTLRGKKAEENLTSTALYVGGNGALTIMPDTQSNLDFNT